ncbi:MAG: hypothetical protein U0167_03735 [bacterium]
MRVPLFLPFALLCGLALCAAGRAPVAPSLPPASELEKLRHEVQRPTEEEDPFASGTLPDFVLLSTTDVEGEIAPCG